MERYHPRVTSYSVAKPLTHRPGRLSNALRAHPLGAPSEFLLQREWTNSQPQVIKFGIAGELSGAASV